jgi:chromate reductase
MKILAISGSLRADSSNTHILHAAAALADPGVYFEFYTDLESIPPFMPGTEVERSPAPVQELRRRLKEADGVFICTPEYAFGVPGVLKNALDWTVSSGEFNEKQVAVTSASPLFLGGDKAHASLMLTMKALGTEVPEGGTLTIPSVKIRMDAKGQIVDPQLTEELRGVVKALISGIRSFRSQNEAN